MYACIIHVCAYIYMFTYIYTHIHVCVYVYIYIYIHTHLVMVYHTPSPPTKSFDFRGFDSSRLLILKGGNSYV